MNCFSASPVSASRVSRESWCHRRGATEHDRVICPSRPPSISTDHRFLFFLRLISSLSTRGHRSAPHPLVECASDSTADILLLCGAAGGGGHWPVGSRGLGGRGGPDEEQQFRLIKRAFGRLGRSTRRRSLSRNQAELYWDVLHKVARHQGRSPGRSLTVITSCNEFRLLPLNNLC